MLRPTLLVLTLTHAIAYVTDPPTFAERLDKLYEKLEKFTLAPQLKTEDKLLAKLDRLNSLNPNQPINKQLFLSDEEEELLSAMQVWGMLKPEQLEKVAKEMQKVKEDIEKNEKMEEYVDGDWGDEDLQDIAEDYANDDWDSEYSDSSTSKPAPSAITRLVFKETTLDPIAATNERPKILDDSTATPLQKSAFLRATLAHIRAVVQQSKCLTPQPRWLSVRQLAPAADTVYMPPCIQLHRCAPDAGCCYDESEVCSPTDGEYVVLPFYLNKADGNFTVARMKFFNHTRCSCVSRENLQSAAAKARDTEERNRIDTEERARVETEERARVETEERNRVDTEESQLVRRESSSQDRQNDWRSTEEPKLEKEEPTAPPQMRRCTCPALFLAKPSETGCTCGCEWPDINRRRDCLSFARGREHFSLRDRVCVVNGDCTTPTCEYGVYERSTGRCPLRRYRRTRYHHRSKLV